MSFVGLAPDFELLFERFELLGGLAYLERYNKVDLKAELASAEGFVWFPVGRACWNTSNSDKLLSQMQTESMKAALVKAGFGKGDPEFQDVFVTNFERISRRVRWW